MKTQKLSIWMTLSLTAIALQGCGKGNDSNAGGGSYSCGSEACPETQIDASPAKSLEERMIGFWKDNTGNLVRVFKSTKSGPLRVTGNTFEYRGKSLFLEAMDIAPDAKDPKSYSGEGKFKGSTDSTSAYLKLEDDGRMQYAFGLHQSGNSMSSISWLTKVDTRSGANAFIRKSREIGVAVDVADSRKCSALITRASTLIDLQSVMETALYNHYSDCFDQALEAMKTDQARLDAVHRYGIQTMLIKNPSAGIYTVLKNRKLISTEELNSSFNALANKIANGHEAECRESRIDGGQTYCVSTDGYKLDLFSKMILDNPAITGLRDIYDSMEYLDEETSAQTIDLVKPQNRGQLPQDKPNRFTALVIASHYGSLSIDRALFLIDLFKQNGWDLNSDKSDSLRKELVENGNPELYHYFHVNGIRLSKENVAFARSKLIEARTYLSKPSAGADFSDLMNAYEYINNLKSVISEATSGK